MQTKSNKVISIRINKLVKAQICNLRTAGSLLTTGSFAWYEPLASLSFHVASVTSDPTVKLMEWIRVKIIPRLLMIHPSILAKSKRVLGEWRVNRT